LIKRIAVLTSGGDAPGMNAAIRAVTRAALGEGWDVYGVRRGYAGLIEANFEPLNARSVGGIIQQGGTTLGSARSPELIDNDLAGSDITIGVDTALNIALEAIDRLKITASSHQRAFLVEVMGRNCGYLALVTGIAGGAEMIVIPEIEATPEEVAQGLRAAYERGKAHAIAVVAEGAKYDADTLAAYFREHHARIGFDLRSITLGHIQRGGAPTAYDRLLATRLGAGAVTALARGETGVLVGMVHGRVATTPLTEVVGIQKPIDPELLALAKVLER
jgi:6-phosphofructokinase 1